MPQEINVSELQKRAAKAEDHQPNQQIAPRPDPNAAALSVHAISSPFSSMHGFVSAQRMAQALCTSDLVPPAYQGHNKIGNCLLALEIAQRTRMPIMLVLQNLHVIHGRTSWSSAYIISCINMSGRFKEPLEFHEVGERGKDSWGVYASAVSNAGKTINGPVVTMGMAKAEGWTSKKGSKWNTIPDLMLRYRAAAWFGRTVCPELMMGMQAAEEVNDGAIIDVTPTIVPDYRGSREEAPEAPPKKEAAGHRNADPLVTEIEADLEAQGYYEANGDFINANGDIYDPEIHAQSSETGGPIINKDGSFRLKRGKAAEVEEAEEVEAEEVEAEEVEEAEAEAEDDDEETFDIE